MTFRPVALALSATLASVAAALAQPQGAPVRTPVPRPPMQIAPAQAAPAQAAPAPAKRMALPQTASFATFLKELWPDAQAKGVTRQTFDLAFAGVTPDPRIIPITQRQPEFGQSVGAYIASFASKARIEAGMRRAAEHAATLNAIEKRYGVDRYLLLAIWGVETSYGTSRDRWDVIRSLSTLAQAHWRHPFFRDELIDALLILQQHHVAREAMLGSWAGAMGQPQFMPSSFLQYAVDFTGDGKRNIWTNVPDVLASIANYFRQKGWTPGLAPSFEVVVPPNFDHRQSRGSFDDWRVLGLRRADGKPFPKKVGNSILFFPSGAGGPAFLVTDNFIVIKRYNNSDVYALAATQLADRMRGRRPIQARWPANDRQPSMAERIALQRKLAELGYPVSNFTGHFDFELRDAIRDVQTKAGLVPDGHPTPALLQYAGVTR
jgi:peptidoglycan lytic transglycosylase B